MTTDHDLTPIAPTPPGLYRHYKGGLYQVIATARHSETLAPMTVYRALYGEHGLWVRPSGMFAEMVDVAGASQPRFVRIGDAPVQGEGIDDSKR